MAPWLILLRNALGNEFERRPLVMTLATSDTSGAARARTIVCRRIGDDGGLFFVSDARSDKNRHLRHEPRAEAVVWLEAALQQFRFQGDVELITSGRQREELWRDLSPASRALFYWPPPGEPFDDRLSFPKEAGEETTIPESFEVLLLHPRAVERLDLAPHPHDRRRWDAVANRWDEIRLNP